MLNQDGLGWVQTTFGLEPTWTKEPDVGIIAHIARQRSGGGGGDGDEKSQIDVTSHAKGAFNKLHEMSTTDATCLMRVSLPVDSRYKTESEVATLEFVRQETSIPVPSIIASDANNENELGFEWIMMEMMPGVTLRQAWRKMSWDAKEEIVRRLVKHQAQLFERPFQKIGNVFRQNNQSLEATMQRDRPLMDSFTLDRMVCQVFFWGHRLTYDVPRGPFTSSHDWLKARLQFVLADQQRLLST